MFELTGKKAIITGGGSGIGKAMALLFARQGAAVYIVDRDKETALSVVNEITLANGESFAFNVDISRQMEVQKIFETIGQIDILINNAGIAHIGNVEQTSEEDLDRLLNVNVKGLYNCLKYGVAAMKAKGGVILNMSSIAAHVGITDRFAYSMTKGAVHAMTLSVARDYLAAGIRCNSISPARVHTPFVDNFLHNSYTGHEEEMFARLSKSQPIGRMGKPEEVAALALFLCSNEASFITGCDYPVDGGFITLNN